VLRLTLKALQASNRGVTARCIHFDSALAVAALVATLLSSYSQSSPLTFESTYGGTADDIGFETVQTSDGGYVFTGVTESFGAGGYDAYLVKTDAYGDTLWTKIFGGAKDDVGQSVQQTTDGGYMIAGVSQSFGAGGDDVYLIRTDPNGDTVWTRTFGGSQDESPSSVERTVDGGCIVCGNTSSFGAGGEDVWLIKTDSNGDTLWTRTFGGSGNDAGTSVQQTTDGGYIISGTTRSFGAGSKDVWLIKTDSMGDTLWTKTFGGDSIDCGGSAQQTADGGYIVVGWTFSYSDSPRIYLVKTNAGGDTLWTKTIGGRGWVEGFSGAQVKDGGYIIVGICGVGLPDVYLVRTDANGDTLWTRTFGGLDFDGGYSVQQTADGGYVIAGQTYSFGAGLSDFYLIKTDSAGKVAVAEPKASPPRAPVLSLTCEPNPFCISTKMSLSTQVSNSKPQALRVYDVQGRLVRTLAVNRESHTIWDGRDDMGQLLPSGTYLVRCSAATEHAATRLVLQH